MGWQKWQSIWFAGAIAQLGERIVRNDEVVGSIPTSSTNKWLKVNNLDSILGFRT